jgi:starch phosphorylase
MADLFDRYLGPAWRENPADADLWQRVDEIPDAELWRTHERRRERLIAFARRRLRSQLENRGAPPSEIEQAKGVLDPEALTIGFGRRFATYKRATLIFRDLGRLIPLLNDEDRPVQIIFAGKAHPADHPGKELIRNIVQLARGENLRRRIVLIEDYDMCVARYMVQGVDLWLNNPRRFREASGTSGMKATANGAINMSILDGWWDEAYEPEIGWAIGRGEVYEDHDYQDQVESSAIYDILEKEVIPFFYERGPDGLPSRWIARMKAAMRVCCPYFNTARMVGEYAELLYLPAKERHQRLNADQMAGAKALAHWKANLHHHWSQVKLVDIKPEELTEIKVGHDFKVTAVVHLSSLEPKDVLVQLYHGPINTQREISPGTATVMGFVEGKGQGNYVFSGAIPCRLSGRYGYSLRVLPQHEDLNNPFEPRLIHWAWS